MLANFEYQILKHFFPVGQGREAEVAYQNQNKLRALLGDKFLASVQGKVVIDFGCGHGNEAIEMVRNGAARVIGIDTWEDALEKASANARNAEVEDRCKFGRSTDEKADLIISVDAFEHFSDPGAILKIMAGLSKPDGRVCISFGPTWLHPLGGHLFSVFPWAHLLFSEQALIRWRSDFRKDGATKFSEVAGGLNGITIRKFKRIVSNSPFEIESLEAVPIRRLAWLHNRITQEFFTAIVRCSLIRKKGTSSSSELTA